MSPNPYDWTRHSPARAVVRADLLAEMSRLLRGRKGCVLLGGRGMGKSVLLQQVEARIQEDDPSVRVVRLDGPPAPPTLRGSLKVLGILNLSLPSDRRGDLAELLREDLGALLSSIHDWSPDFFRPGKKAEAKQIVPESVFAAFLGWGSGCGDGPWSGRPSRAPVGPISS